MTPDLRERLMTLGYYWGETYYFDPNKATMCWLQSDFAGSAWPVNDDERIALLTIIDGHDCATPESSPVDVEAVLFDTLYAGTPPEGHGQLCPVWTNRRYPKKSHECDCWVADKDRRLARKLARRLSGGSVDEEGDSDES